MSADAATSKKAQQATRDAQRAIEQQERIRNDPKAQRGAPMYFPLTYKEAVYQWWSSVTAAVAERNVLSYVPFLKEAGPAQAPPPDTSASSDAAKADPYGPRTWQFSMVPLSGKNRALHELCIERTGERADDTLVMLHGYGAGLGFYYRNFEPLSRVPGWRLYALDMLGMGNSTRPPFRIRAKDPAGKVAEAEGWFIDALEEWRKARNIDRFTLMGHSLGGYLAVSYALKYPGRLNKLILASPVGIPEDPYAVTAPMPDASEAALATDLTPEQSSIVNNSTLKDANANPTTASLSSAASSSAAAKSNNAVAAPPRKRPQPSWLVWLWDANVSPFSLVRLTGPLGPRFTSGWTSRRFSHLPPEEAAALHTYTYTLFRQRGSGEYALPYILAPGAYARRPVLHKISGVGRQPLTQTPAAATAAEGAASTAPAPAPAASAPRRETGIPVVMMYGENDWMDVAGGYAAEEKLRQARERALASATAEERARENGSARVLIVRGAGHNVFLDSPDHFNELVAREMEETRAQTLRRRKEAAAKAVAALG